LSDIVIFLLYGFIAGYWILDTGYWILIILFDASLCQIFLKLKEIPIYNRLSRIEYRPKSFIKQLILFVRYSASDAALSNDRDIS